MERGRGWRKYGASTAGSVLTVAQVVLWIVWGFGDVAWLAYTGLALWWVGVVFAWAPIVQFKRRGGVPEGAQCAHTTALVDTGIYLIGPAAILTHPARRSAAAQACAPASAGTFPAARCPSRLEAHGLRSGPTPR